MTENVVEFKGKPAEKSQTDIMADDLQTIVDKFRAGEITSYAIVFVGNTPEGGLDVGSAYDATANVAMIIAGIAHMQHEILTGQAE